MPHASLPIALLLAQPVQRAPHPRASSWQISETDRYMARPAQALGYKSGQLKILALRERGKTELAPRFDVRAFHDEVLGGGAMPLDVLEMRIAGWIGRSRQAAPAGAALH
jgi:hypothetical protein